jgi:Fe-S-cluster containining protein
MATTRVRVALKLYGEPVAFEGDAPEGAARLDEILPVFRKMDDAVIDRAIARVEAAGEKVSCAKGCSACCRAQPVPVTPPEAAALWRLVASLPEPRQAQVRAAFANRVARLRAAGLYDTLLYREQSLSREEARDLAHRYFRLGLVCPFLVDDACSIYEDRPFVCRQYLVTSPVPLCSDPLNKPVKPVPMPLRFATGMLTVAEQSFGRTQHTVPLVLALEYAQAHCEELDCQFDGRETFERFMKALASD